VVPKRVWLVVIALVCALVGIAPVITGSGDPEPRAKAQQAAGDRRTDRSVTPGQTSEGIQGELVEPTPFGRPLRSRVTNQRAWKVAPGVRYKRWDQTDRRGRIRAHLLTIDWDRPGVSLDYESGRHVPDSNTVSGYVARDHAVAGVNGGFFDIHDTGAPLGVGVDRQRGFLHAARYTWNNAFYLARNGTPGIGRLDLSATVDQYPQMPITNVNSPRVRVGSIGVYGPDWGWTSGYRITDGQTKGIRMVVIRGGRVIANRTSLNSNKLVDSTVLVGRGPGATQLQQMRVGSTATVRWGLVGRPEVAISGEKILLSDGKVLVDDDRELHPRTAIGIDRDRGLILLLVVDGRSSTSRGYTLVEEARLMRKLGAEDALNLDGGGSSTLVAARNGRRKVRNAPSDGAQRHVADAIGVKYTRP
jgi:exopolysaccharide biosynthesis protein